jgi:hypothetical protein
MKKDMILLSCLLIVGIASQSATRAAEHVFYFPQIGDGTVGGIQFQTSLILVNTGPASDVVVEFFDSVGNPIDLSLGGQPAAHGFEYRLDPGIAISTETSGTGELRVGYARVTADSGVGGTAVFTRKDAATGVVLYEAGVAASPTLTAFTVFVDSTGLRDTGLALVSPPLGHALPAQEGPPNVVMRLYDTSFQEIATTNVPLSEGAHLPRFIHEFFDAVPEAREMQGTLTVQSDRPIAALTLRQTEDPARPFPQSVPTLTTFPVIPGAAEEVAVSGSFHSLGAGRVALELDLRRETRPVEAVLVTFLTRGEKVHRMLRGPSSSGWISEVIDLPPDAGTIPVGAEFRLLYADGEVGPKTSLE